MNYSCENNCLIDKPNNDTNKVLNNINDNKKLLYDNNYKDKIYKETLNNNLENNINNVNNIKNIKNNSLLNYNNINKNLSNKIKIKTYNKNDEYFTYNDYEKLRHKYNNESIYDTLHDKRNCSINTNFNMTGNLTNMLNKTNNINNINLFQTNNSMLKSVKKGDLIGEGAFGKVYQGFDEDTGIIIAIKEIDLKKIAVKGLDSKLSTFEQEILILSKLNHRNIVKYIGTIKTKDNCLQILLEYCIGGSIAKLLEVYKNFPEPVIKKYTKQILEGLEFLHFNNIIHRDIKGGNILVDRDGVCKLSDFGGSKIVVEELEFENQKSFKGTPNWMAPEVIKRYEHSRFSDIWSLGCTIIEMLTGEPPWSQYKNHMAALFHILKTENPPEIPSIASPKLKDFLEKCLNMDPFKRPNVSQLLNHEFLY